MSDPTLAGRTLLVTGGGRRLGAAIARHLGARGARVVVHYHGSRQASERLVGELPAGSVALGADLASPDGPADLLAACATAGAEPDGVVHGAATFLRRPLAATSAADWDAVFALNLRAFFLLARDFARRRGERGGDLVAIADAAGLELWPNYLAHSVSKAALIALVQGLAKALAPRYRVNVVIPGPVLPPDGASQAQVEAMAQRTLLGRLGEPGDVASAVEFMLTCGYATGTTLEVTGGSHLWRRPGG